jgi:hypothetical protein
LKYQQRFEAHRAADEVIQGTGFENGRGCFVGCTLDAYEHERFPVELGWSQWLAHLADNIFEGIPAEEAPQFGTDLLEAVQTGSNLESVKWKLAIWRHEQQLERLKDNSAAYAQQVRDALTQVIAYCKACLEGTQTEENRVAARCAAKSARSAARSASDSAAWSAADSAWSAACSAADSVVDPADSAWSAAWSASCSAADSADYADYAAKSAYWRQERDMLLQLIRECKPVA